MGCYNLRTNIKSDSSSHNSNGLKAATLISVVKTIPKISDKLIQSPLVAEQKINCTSQQQQEKLSNAGSMLPIPPAHSLSMSDVSDMLFEFYKANTAKAPKNNKISKASRQPSPSSADGVNTSEMITTTPILTITPTKNEQKLSDDSVDLVSSKATQSVNDLISISKNVNGDEMVAQSDLIKHTTPIQKIVKEFGKKLNAPFHPRIKYSNINNKSNASTVILAPTTISSLSGDTTTIHTVLSSTNTASTTSSPAKSQTPVVVIPSSVIQSPILNTQPAAAVLAAALLRDGYQNLHQQIRAQEQLLKHHRQQDNQSNSATKINDQQQNHDNKQNSGQPQLPSKYIQTFLQKNHRYSDENEQQSSSDEEDEDDDEEKYPEIDDIHLIEGAKSAFNAANQMSLSMDADYMSDESHKYSMIAAHALRNLEYSWSDYGGRSGGDGNGGLGHIGPNGEIESMYNCRHCGKKYRWKSTLRRHENVECGGKEPSHQCPYCPYKSKQRGNLGVHVRKHHANLPQLASKRRSKYSQPRD